MSAMVCECSHPQSRHAGDTFGCRGCEYHCGRYTPDIAAARDAESTSAALARVTAELATERDKRAEDIAAFGRACVELATAEQERDAAKAQLDRADRALKARDTSTEVIYAYASLYCRTCYGRYFEGTDAAENHEHPLVPVTVTITRRTAE